jgi:hypothetical protein
MLQMIPPAHGYVERQLNWWRNRETRLYQIELLAGHLPGVRGRTIEPSGTPQPWLTSWTDEVGKDWTWLWERSPALDGADPPPPPN